MLNWIDSYSYSREASLHKHSDSCYSGRHPDHIDEIDITNFSSSYYILPEIREE